MTPTINFQVQQVAVGIWEGFCGNFTKTFCLNDPPKKKPSYIVFPSHAGCGFFGISGWKSWDRSSCERGLFVFCCFLHPQRQPTFPKCPMGLECLSLYVSCLYIYRKVKQNVVAFDASGFDVLSVCLQQSLFHQMVERKRRRLLNIYTIYCNHPFGLCVPWYPDHNKALASQYSLSNQNSLSEWSQDFKMGPYQL